jgi:hypothetical protein
MFAAVAAPSVPMIGETPGEPLGHLGGGARNARLPPVLPWRRHEIREPVQELNRRDSDDAVGSRSLVEMDPANRGADDVGWIDPDRCRHGPHERRLAGPQVTTERDDGTGRQAARKAATRARSASLVLLIDAERDSAAEVRDESAWRACPMGRTYAGEAGTIGLMTAVPHAERRQRGGE